MNGQAQQEKVRIIDAIGISLIGGVSFFYTVYARHFSQIHIQLPFLDFPVFVGEILLFICSLLLLIRFCILPPKRGVWFYCILGYLLWVLLKTLHGYFTYGPLAFRNAALFYYLFFGVLTYTFFRREFITQKAMAMIVIGILAALLLRKYYLVYHYYHYEFFVFIFILGSRLRSKVLKILIALTTLYVLMHWTYFGGSKSHMLALSTSLMFVMTSYFFYFLRIRARFKVLIFVAGLVFLAGLILLTTDRTKIKSLLTIERFLKSYAETDRYIKEREVDFKFKEIPAKLYSEERESSAGVSYKVFNGKVIPSGLFKTIGRLKESVESNSYKAYLSHLAANSGKPDAIEVSETVINKTIRNEVIDFEAALVGIIQDYAGLSGSKGLSNKKVEREAEVRMAAAANAALEKIVMKINNLYSPIQDQTPADNVSDVTRDTGKETMTTKEDVVSNATQEGAVSSAPQTISINEIESRYQRDLNTEHTNMLFRVFIWRDMIREILSEKAVLGINLGKPQRSKSIEILKIAWGEWSRDGWITPHNSYLHMIYRGGIVGVVLVILILTFFLKLMKCFIDRKSMTGILLMSVLLYWMIMSNFLVILELPYSAIPFWGLFGALWAYTKLLNKDSLHDCV